MSEINQRNQAKNSIKDFIFIVKQKYNQWAEKLLPSKEIQRGAGWAVGISVVLAALVIGADMHTGFGIWVDILGAAFLAGLGYFVLQILLRLIFSIINKSLSRLVSISVAGMVFWLSFSNLKEELVFWPLFFLLLNLMLFGGVISFFLSNPWNRLKIFPKTFSSFIALFSISFIFLFIYWLLIPGTEDHILSYAPYQGESNIEIANPSEPGPYAVLKLTYGSGTDLRREDYGEEVDLITHTVNASSFVYNPNPSINDFKDWFSEFPEKDFPLEDWIESKLRFWYWGFDRTEYPLNAQVWYPEGEGSFPLVLMVHGNHDMVERSELGYAYLGELLASRGYIFVSVDENFLNGYFAGGISGENDARGWLLLKHLELWEEWHRDSLNPFSGKVDLNNIALIGHSRGGEAVSVAAAFNKLDNYPDNGIVKFDFQFNIRSVIAIAPVDQQYQPADTPLPLVDINYLVLQGAHDADVSSFSGLRQYQRVSFSDIDTDLFKSAIYIYQANHSQFNSDWGRHDLSLPRGLYLNTQPLLPPDQQREIAKVYISAFLDTTLKDEQAYQAIFEDYHNAGDWLPPTLYKNQYLSSSFTPIARFEEDIDLTTTSVVGGRIEVFGLSRWKEAGLDFRTGKEQDNHVVNLAWSRIGGRFDLILPINYFQENQIDELSYLVFNLADDRDLQDNHLDLSVSISDNRGQNASLPLSSFAEIVPDFQVKFTKFEAWEVDKFENSTETIMQAYRIQISKFLNVNPDLNIHGLTTISYIFDISPNGRILIDEIGIE